MNIKLTIGRQENADYFGVNINDTIDLDFEEYLIGVVASEIGNANLEACKAQAIASRTYGVSRNALIGQPLSDSNNVMAFRASRMHDTRYANAARSVQQTTGIILTYNGEPIRAVYSANNGGRTTSSKERWGSHYDYLIEQEDPWDAADGRAKTGHGVGLSQRGAAWAGAHSYNYQQILAFYYPHTILSPNYGQGVKSMNVLLNDKAAKVVQLAKSRLGYPYVYAGAGQACTPTNRQRKVDGTHSDIINKCQVLKGAADSCDNCKYQGKQFFDCRGFTYWLLQQVGVSISATGATTQYNTASSWIRRGQISDLPNVVCSVFKYVESQKKMSHTGMHIGNGVIIHCTGVKLGEVQYDATSGNGWTHFAVPKNLYTEDELNSAELVQPINGLKRGASGLAVTELQEKLNKLGYSCTIDGHYGTNTSDAVKQFQKAYNLTVDGLAGAITRTLILNLTYDDQPQIVENNIPTVSKQDLVTIQIDKNLAKQLYNLLQKALY